MSKFESNFNMGGSEIKKENIKINKNENLKFNFDNLSEQHLRMTETIVENVGPYLDHKVEIKFRDFVKHNPGMHCMLLPKFKTEDHYDSISINSNFEDKNGIPYYLLHELGHSFQEQIKEVAILEFLKIYPEDGDEESEYFEDYSFGEFQSDFFVAYVMNKEYLQRNIKTEIEKNTLQVYEKLFSDNNFEEIKNSINENEANYKAEILRKYESGEVEKPEWLSDDYMNIPIYERAFDAKVNEEYKKYFSDLETKYQKE